MTIADGVLSQALGDEAVLLHLGTGTYFGLDPVGARIWQWLQQSHSLQAIYQRLCDEYDAEPHQLSDDLLRLISRLRKERLVQDA